MKNERLQEIAEQIINKTKVVFGVGNYGGEYKKALDKVKELKKQQFPPEAEEAMRKYERLTSDFGYRSDCLTMKEREMLDKELPPLEAAAQIYYESVGIREQALKNAEEEVRLIERKINYWKARKKSLEVIEEPASILQREKDIRTLAGIKISIVQARTEIESVMSGLEAKIEELKEKRKTATPEEALAIGVEIRECEAAVHKNLESIIPDKQQFIQEQLERQKHFEALIRISEESFEEAKQQCVDQLIELWGKID